MSLRTPKLITLALTILAGTALLAFAACGGDDDDNKTTAPTGTSQSTGGGSTRTGGTTATATEAPDDNGGDGDPFAELQSLSGDVQQIKGKVTYTQTDANASGDTSSSLFTIYSAPPKQRYDTSDPNDPSSDGTYIVTPDGNYFCSANDQTCIAYPGGSASGIGFFGSLFNPAVIQTYVNALNGIEIDTSSESIAGTDAKCYSWTDSTSTDATKGKVCFSDSGLMLLDTEDSDGSTSSLRASNVSTSVSDSDFEPPYPVTTLPPIPGQ